MLKMVIVVMNNSRSDNDSTLVRIVAFVVVVMLIAPDVNMIVIVAEEGLVTNYCTLTMAQI